MPVQRTNRLNAALALQEKGDLGGAESAYNAILAGDPEDPDALCLLGAIQQQTGRAALAVETLRKAIAAAGRKGRKPDISWRLTLGMALRDAGDLSRALSEFNGLVEDSGGSPDALFSRAGLLQRLGRHQGAIRDYQAFLKIVPGHPSAMNNLGVALRADGRLAEAFDVFNRTVELNPRYVQAAVNAGHLLRDAGKTEAARDMLQRARAHAPDDRNALLTLIDVLFMGGEVDEAEKLAGEELERHPEDPRVMVLLGRIRLARGESEEAAGLARRALALIPKHPGAQNLLAEAAGDEAPEEMLHGIEALIANRTPDPATLAALHNTAAELCSRLDRHIEAFDHYAAGNAARGDLLARMNQGYNRARTETLIDRTVAAFTAETIAAGRGSDSQLPVFIVGMPRSGTTLSEQILASHPEVFGAGELPQIGQIDSWLRRLADYPETIPRDKPGEAAEDYLSQIRRIGKGAARVTDKMPGNFMHLGLIARMFRRARIIHCRRDPVDTCLSCFAQNFKADGLAWSNDFDDLAHYYGQYRRIMAHWRAVLPAGRMLEVDYEDMVSESEAQARRLVDFAGLDWDDSCLRFYETDRAVRTASRTQVRRPIYKSSVGRWRRYGDRIAPLVRALRAAGLDVPADAPR